MQPLLLLIGLSNDLSSTWGDFLDRCGFRVPPDEDGGTAAATVRRHRPDVVVLDLSRTSDIGLHVITEIHREAPVPIIVLAEAAEVDPVERVEPGRRRLRGPSGVFAGVGGSGAGGSPTVSEGKARGSAPFGGLGPES